MSLSETLVAVLILGLVTLGVAAGVRAAMNCYQDLMFSSESGILVSSLNESVKDTLRNVAEVSTSGRADSDGYKSVEDFKYSASVYDSSTDEFVSGVVDTSVNFSINNSSQLQLGDAVVGGTGIYAEDLKLSNFELSYNETDRIFRFSYKVSDQSGTNQIESGDVFVNRLHQ